MIVRRRFTVLFITAAVLIAAMRVMPRSLVDPLGALVATATYPFARAFSYFSYETRDIAALISSIGALKDENVALRRENVRLQSENARLAQLADENDRLRAELTLVPREKYDLLAGEVIAFGANDRGKYITINRGADDEVTRGMAVIAGQGVLVGSVERVTPLTCEVMLLTHPDSVVPVTGASTQALGLARGEHGLGLILDMVLPNQILEKGEVFLTSGLGGGFPRGLLVGNIGESRFSPDRLYRQATILAPLSADDLRFVYVVRKVL